MYLSLEKASEKLNLSQSEILTYRALNEIYYSQKTDKYEIESILQKRTMTIPLEKLLNRTQKEELLELMKDYSKLKHTIFSRLQKGTEYKNSGINRIHREISKEINSKFTNPIADSALSTSKGIIKSTKTWKEKKIKNLEDKILKIRTILTETNENKVHKNFFKGKKKQLKFLENKLADEQSRNYMKVHFGKKYLGNKDEYQKSRQELFVEGSQSNKGNSTIRIQFNKNGERELKLFNYKIQGIKIPNSHKKTFTLTQFNRQSCRIAFNKKGKLVIHITYSYIKPLKNDKVSNGTIGIDIGPKEIAIAFVKNDGNPLKYKHYSIGNLLDKRTEETQRILSNILDEIIDDASSEEFYHFTIENLNFSEKYKYRSKKLNRMLSKFPHQIFEDLIKSKTNRRGLKLKMVNPAFTSIIGIFKYSNRDNLNTSHNAKSKDLSAALVIGRRGLGFYERAVVSVRISGRIVSKAIKSLLDESEKDSSKFNSQLSKRKTNSNWNLWSKLNRKFTFKELTAQLNEVFEEPIQESS